MPARTSAAAAGHAIGNEAPFPAVATEPPAFPLDSHLNLIASPIVHLLHFDYAGKAGRAHGDRYSTQFGLNGRVFLSRAIMQS